MKKSLFFAAAAALLTLVSCEKESPVLEFIGNDPVFYARISNTTRTTIEETEDHRQAKVSWVENDVVYITDGLSNTVKYLATNVDGGSATLVKDPNESGSLDASGPYTAIYGTAPSTSQTYSAQAPALPMTGTLTDINTFNFEVTCGLLKLTLTKADELITSIEVSDGPNTYTLTCNPPVSIATVDTFYIALPPADYKSFTFIDSQNKACHMTLKQGETFTISANKIRPLSFSTGLNFHPETLSGEFVVDAGPDETAGTADDVKVRFSRGNLQYQASTGTWRFAANQYDFIGDNYGNKTTENRNAQTAWIDLFGWGTTGVDHNPNAQGPDCVSTLFADYTTLSSFDLNTNSTETATRENNGDWGVCMGTGWHMLNKTELTNLKSYHTYHMSVVEVYSNEYVYGLVIMPYGHKPTLTDDINLTTWQTLEADGAVFLPCAGYRNATAVTNSTLAGYYWSTGAVGKNADSMTLNPKEGYNPRAVVLNTTDRRYGASVRLVVNVE